MIRGQHKDGTVFWKFEKSELDARRRFEECLIDTDLQAMFDALFVALQKKTQRKAENWQKMREYITSEFGDEPKDLAYDWLSGEITEQKDEVP